MVQSLGSFTLETVEDKSGLNNTDDLSTVPHCGLTHLNDMRKIVDESP
jgi:hypothetical protein